MSDAISYDLTIPRENDTRKATVEEEENKNNVCPKTSETERQHETTSHHICKHKSCFALSHQKAKIFVSPFITACQHSGKTQWFPHPKY